MAKTKEQKETALKELKESIKKQKAIIFVDFTGLKVEDMFELRRNLKKVDSNLRVAKKTLIKLAFKASNLKFDDKSLKGEIALIFGFKDEISPSKAVYQICEKNENIKILGGFLENQFRGAEDFISLAKLPSREELLARLAGSLSSPITNFVRALEYNIKGLVHILSKIKT